MVTVFNEEMQTALSSIQNTPDNTPHHDAKHLMMMMDQMHITPQDAIDAQPNLVHLNIFDGQLCKGSWLTDR